MALVEFAEALGPAAFVLIGLGGLIAGGAFLENFLPFGTPGDAALGGHDPAGNMAVGLAVAGGFACMLSEFLEQTLVRAARRGAAALMGFLPYVVAAWVLLIGLYGMVTSRDLIHLVICLSVVQSSTYVLLLAIGYKRGGARARVRRLPPGTRVVDPVVQALTLTDVVVGATVTALLLAIAVQAHKRTARSIRTS